jgi:hypothetical protein
MNYFPYDVIEMCMNTEGYAYNLIELKLNEDCLTIKRDYDPIYDELEAIAAVDLTFSIDNAYKLRDFLNFALPKEQ